MRQRLLCVLIAILMVLSLTGCAKKDDGGKEKDSPAKDASSKTSTQSGDNSSGEVSTSSENSLSIELPSDLLNASWPVDILLEELPEYTAGTVTASGKDDGILYIKIKDTDKSELYVYLGQLRDSGWIVASDDTEAEAMLGPCTVNFQLQGDGTVLQIDVFIEEIGTWPTSKIPSDIIPPHAGILIGEVEILETMEDVWYFNYTCDGIDEAAAAEYMEMLRQDGWEGDDMMVFKGFEWNSKQYKASIEIYETLETRTTFSCNFWLEE